MVENIPLFKVILVGDAKVGKSSLLHKFTDNRFSESYISTIGVDFKLRQIEIEEISANLQIWDTAGEERFKAITSSYYKGANAFIIMYDCSNRLSFENLPSYMNGIRNYSSDDSKFLVVETQINENSRVVTVNEGQVFAASINSQFISVNNRTGLNVEQAFIMILRSLLNLQNTIPVDKEPISESQEKTESHPEANKENIEILSKILIVGDSGVGKSCLVAKYADDVFYSEYIPTIGVDFRIRHFTRNGVNHKLQIWDTAGQERFRTITSSYYNGCNGVIILFNINDSSSYENLQLWIEEVKKHASNSVKIMIAGNEFNDSNRAVTFDQASEYATSVSALYTEVNAKTGYNIQEPFEGLAEIIYRSRVSTN